MNGFEMAALTYRIGILRNGKIKYAVVNDPISMNIELAKIVQIKNWREELVSIEFRGEMIYQPNHRQVKPEEFVSGNFDEFIYVDPIR